MPELSDTTIPVRTRNSPKLRSTLLDRTEYMSRTAKKSHLPGSISASRCSPLAAEPDSDRRYGVCTLLIPALGTRLVRNGVEATGRSWPREREGRPFSTSALAFSESWTEAV
jgi:hypothetical protein